MPTQIVPSAGGDQRREVRFIKNNSHSRSPDIFKGSGEMMAQHVSVLLERCIELLSPAIKKVENPVVVDATLGLGGHTEALLRKFPNLIVIGIDRDEDAIAHATSRLEVFGDRFKGVHAVYDQIQECIEKFGYKKVDGILFDLGVSSMQLDEVDRGFSYANDAPLDMRMDRSQGRTAADIINFAGRDELIMILRKFGEERFAPRIVDAIIRRRAISPMDSTAELAALVKENIPAATRRTGGNPAKRTFQALRIAVNDELDVLTRAIPSALEALVVGGRLVVMSFQSLEDRIVKEFFVAASESKTPRELPVEIPELAAKFMLVIRGSERSSEEELIENPRSASVRLRAIERVAA